MKQYRYHALDNTGKLVGGVIASPTATELGQRLERQGLVLLDSGPAEHSARWSRFSALFNRPRSEDVTVFSRDIALLLRAGARIHDSLELLATDPDIGRLRPVIGDIRSRVVAGESFAEALSRHEALFPPMYVALIRVGENSGMLPHVFEVLADERSRAEALRRRLADALRYPLFVLGAACCVLLFFLTFVLPQFASVLQDYGARIDPMISGFLALSSFLHDNVQTLASILLAVLITAWLLLRRPRIRHAMRNAIARLPLVRRLIVYHQTALFCRNLGILLGSNVTLTTTLRILVDMLATAGSSAGWKEAADRVRHGAKLSTALTDTAALPGVAVRMLRLAEETGQLPMLAGRVADFYAAKLERSLDRLVGIAGPAAIIVISIVVGGLIVSVMTALLSVNQIVN
jgi:general secretion pathway protein F